MYITQERLPPTKPRLIRKKKARRAVARVSRAKQNLERTASAFQKPRNREPSLTDSWRTWFSRESCTLRRSNERKPSTTHTTPSATLTSPNSVEEPHNTNNKNTLKTPLILKSKNHNLKSNRQPVTEIPAATSKESTLIEILRKIITIGTTLSTIHRWRPKGILRIHLPCSRASLKKTRPWLQMSTYTQTIKSIRKSRQTGPKMSFSLKTA